MRREQSYPTPAATPNPGGTRTVTSASERPADTPEGNWIQSAEGKGYFVILRLYSPLQSYLTKAGGRARSSPSPSRRLRRGNAKAQRHARPPAAQHEQQPSLSAVDRLACGSPIETEPAPPQRSQNSMWLSLQRTTGWG